jgi:hypothetical protein
VKSVVRVAEALQPIGVVENVWVLEGGLDGLREKGLPLSQLPKHRKPSRSGLEPWSPPPSKVPIPRSRSLSRTITPPMIRLRAQDHRVYGQVFRLWPTRPPMAGEPLRSEPRKVFARAIPTSPVNLRLGPDTPGRGQLAEEVYMA